jgi:hypothetical protein
VGPVEDARPEAGQALQVLDHDRMQLDQLVALALVVLGPGDGGCAFSEDGRPGRA